jgi:hypothetical protein
MGKAYGVHSAVNKLLIVNREINPGRITVTYGGADQRGPVSV